MSEDSNWDDVFFIETLLLPQARHRVRPLIEAFEAGDDNTAATLLEEQYNFATAVYGEELEAIDLQRIKHIMIKVHKVTILNKLKMMEENKRPEEGQDADCF